MTAEQEARATDALATEQEGAAVRADSDGPAVHAVVGEHAAKDEKQLVHAQTAIDPSVAAVLAELKKHGVTEAQLEWCDNACVQRYLRARGGNPHKAAMQLRATLEWRDSFNVGSLTVGEFSGRDLQSGRMYIGGNDPTGKSILVTRKRSDAFQAGEQDAYLRYLVFTLETGARAMQGGQDKWCWLMDMRGYSRANSPPLGVSMATLRILADHFPERLHKCYFIDAPGIFSFLFNALWPFIDPVTRKKIVFISTADPAYRTHIDAVAAAGDDEAQREEALRRAAKPEDPDAFCNYLRWYCEPYNADAYLALLKRVGWE